MGINIIKGKRYVPIIKGAWNSGIGYEALSVVTYKGLSYTARIDTPIGVNISNESYWVITGNYNYQIEIYRQEVKQLTNLVNALEQRIEILEGV